jgi:taurine dioxygenase
MSAVETLERNPAVGAAPFGLKRLTGALGAEVVGLDLAQPLTEEVIGAVSDALVRHKVLFFRDQHITRDQHLAFGRRFGPLEVHPFAKHFKGFTNDNAQDEILVIESTAEKPIAADQWHSDVTFRLEPSLGSILRCRIAPEVGGDTLWANMAAAYEGLDDATRSQISGLTAVHDWNVFRDGLRAQNMSEDFIAQLVAEYPPAEHPVVRTHPVSGEKIIYVNSNFTIGIKGMKESESSPLLERLYRQASIPDYQVRFRWAADCVAFWDNRSTQHYATKDFFPEHRLMERVTVAGDRPF